LKTLDRTSPLPLWAQIVDDLRERIAGNELADRFPTDEEMVRGYGVSRQTVREAVRHLENAGIVERQRGRGSFVRRASSIDQPVQGLYSLARSIEAQGLDERSRVIALELVRDASAARKLGLADTAPLVLVERLRFAAGEPLAVDRSWLPEEIAGKLEESELQRGPLYEAITRHAGISVTGGHERIRAANADAATRRLLELPAREAVLVVERLAFSGARAVEWRVSTIRGDRFSFTSDWT
jgi:GntR family transcriptional regulator